MCCARFFRTPAPVNRFRLGMPRRRCDSRRDGDVCGKHIPMARRGEATNRSRLRVPIAANVCVISPALNMGRSERTPG